MKLTATFLPLIFAFLFYGCAGLGSSSNGETTRSGSEVIVDNPNTSLDLYIRKLSGVRVTGSGSSARIIVRGSDSSTFESDPRPLFVLDGVRIGRDFSRVYRMVSTQNVNSLKLIKSNKATIYYGHEGSNGVIEIKTNV